MIQYRIASLKDAASVALFHAQSWQQNYRGILSDDYLDNKIIQDRMDVWTGRFREENEYTIIAEDEGRMCGFACTYGDHDPDWGALLDNLHVAQEWKMQGIGRELMKRSAAWVAAHYPENMLYLWVFEQNVEAIRFYERVGGIRKERISHKNPDGGYSHIFRYVWEKSNIP